MGVDLRERSLPSEIWCGDGDGWREVATGFRAWVAFERAESPRVGVIFFAVAAYLGAQLFVLVVQAVAGHKAVFVQKTHDGHKQQRGPQKPVAPEVVSDVAEFEVHIAELFFFFVQR